MNIDFLFTLAIAGCLMGVVLSETLKAIRFWVAMGFLFILFYIKYMGLG